nr:hypothetical protein [Tanacetum cinerariifolium]
MKNYFSICLLSSSYCTVLWDVGSVSISVHFPVKVPLRLQRANRLFGPRLVKCPVGLFDDENGKHNQDDSDESDDNDENDENVLIRLRYYFAMVICDKLLRLSV